MIVDRGWGTVSIARRNLVRSTVENLKGCYYTPFISIKGKRDYDDNKFYGYCYHFKVGKQRRFPFRITKGCEIEFLGLFCQKTMEYYIIDDTPRTMGTGFMMLICNSNNFTITPHLFNDIEWLDFSDYDIVDITRRPLTVRFIKDGVEHTATETSKGGLFVVDNTLGEKYYHGKLRLNFVQDVQKYLESL